MKGTVKRCAQLWLVGGKSYQAAELTLTLGKLELLELCCEIAEHIENEEAEVGTRQLRVGAMLLDVYDGTKWVADGHRKDRG